MDPLRNPMSNKKFLAKGLRVAFLLFSLGLMAFAVGAHQLGVDKNIEWGPYRKSIFISGVAFLLITLYPTFSEKIKNASNFLHAILCRALIAFFDIPWIASRKNGLVRAIQQGKQCFFRQTIIKWLINGSYPVRNWLRDGLPNSPFGRFFAKSSLSAQWAFVSGLFFIVLLFYLWIVSVGRWDDWPASSEYYDQLADAFLHGQVHLLNKPDTGLATLEDPYDIDARSHVPYIWDVAYFDGKYFLYWGPAPALILMVIKSFTGSVIGDQYLVFGFVSGSFFFSSLSLIALWRRLFENRHWGNLLLPILVAGLANPMPWLLNRPAIYEAAIAAGQFFLIGGIYWAITAFDRPQGIDWRLSLAGVFWALAVGSRATLLGAVIFLPATLMWIILKRRSADDSGRTILSSILHLLIPLVLGATLLAWYNHMRFGSFFETGHRYVFTYANLHKHYEQAFSSKYLLSNLYNYALNTYRTLPVFPFIKPQWGIALRATDFYYTEQVTGILRSIPYVIFSLMLTALLTHRWWRRWYSESDHVIPTIARRRESFLHWIVIALAGAILLSLLPTLFFYSASMRYLADWIPMLIILATLGIWEMSTSLKGIWFILIWLVIAAAAWLSIRIGILLSISGYVLRFEKLNPELFQQLSIWLKW